MTAQALEEKSSLERTADRLARYFLPVVLLAALATLLGHWWWLRGSTTGIYEAILPALAVLVVACPCALILATPAAMLAALGRLAGTGVLVRRVAALEALAQADVVALDKTGTVTRGQLQLGDVVPLAAGVSADELLLWAATAEQRSEHPVAQVIAQAARDKGLTLSSVDEFTAVPGAGVQARSGELVILVGSRRFLETQGVHWPDAALQMLEHFDRTGQTCLAVACRPAQDAAVPWQLLGLIGARDAIRPEAPGVLDALRQLGIRRIALLTGDRAGAASTIAARLGIEEVHAELLPQQKADWIQDNSDQGIASSWSATGSRTHRRWPGPTWASPWLRSVPIWPPKPAISCSYGNPSSLCPRWCV
ncbi:MAG: hypothetical protein C4297_06980 [Gemmataceae bacterium]